MRCGMDENTGKVLTGWDHVQQGIRRAITTRPGALVLRRKIGSGLASLQDENMNAQNVLRAYIAIAMAITPPTNPEWGEPGFRLRKMELVALDQTGMAAFMLTGDYYPNGHLGDYGRAETVSTSLPVREVAA